MDFKRFLSTLVENHIGEYVICPGARNAPLAVALSRSEGLHLWQHFEERSSAFFALGRTMESELPCAVVTTSGTAVAELMPAVIEAHYQGRPLVVISADRPRKFRGSGAPQAIEQAGLFGDYPQVSMDIESLDELDLSGWNKRGVLHINLCIEESFQEDEVQGIGFEEAEAILTNAPDFDPHYEQLDLRGLIAFMEEVWLGFVVIVGGLRSEDQDEVYHFLKRINVPVVADPTSGLRERLGKNRLVDADDVLKNEAPGKILRIGDVPIGRFWRDLETLPDVEVFSVTPTGFSGLARESKVLTANVGRVFRLLGEPEVHEDILDHLRGNGSRQSMIDERLECYPSSEPALVREVSRFAAMADSVYLGNSMPIRHWARFAQTQVEVANVKANRGANGIDGQLSTWMGATTTDEVTWGVFGDLTTLYDLISPTWVKQIQEVNPEQKRVLVVINNQGGRIFERLPRLQSLEEEAKKTIVQPHDMDLKGWAEWLGASYRQVRFADEFDTDEDALFEVIELLPDAEETEQLFADLSRS